MSLFYTSELKITCIDYRVMNYCSLGKKIKDLLKYILKVCNSNFSICFVVENNILDLKWFEVYLTNTHKLQNI